VAHHIGRDWGPGRGMWSDLVYTRNRAIIVVIIIIVATLAIALAKRYG
jgi:hypothetical protein